MKIGFNFFYFCKNIIGQISIFHITSYSANQTNSSTIIDVLFLLRYGLNMRIENNSSINTKTFYPIIDFVTQNTKFSALATLYIDDSKDVFTYGACHKTNPELSDINLVAPSLIELWVRKNAKYPVVSIGVCGEVKVNDRNEEILLVLSHETYHLDNYYGYPVHYPIDQNEAAEIAAEQFAINTLNRWRLKKDFGIG